ncbi:MAG: endonuclease III [Alphaproteobacteria bacterium]|nr:endonuclease III [Alphaproteobacteria bacterium]
MTPTDIENIFNGFRKHNPNPKCELNFYSDYTLLVAIVLSAQTTDANVNKATYNLYKQADTPEKMVALGINKLKEYIRFIGLYNNKAKSVIELSKILINKFNSKVPSDFNLLKSLPGVGRKTANVFLNIAYNQPTYGVDTHVFRLCNRIGIAKGKNVLEVEKKLKAKVEKVLSKEDLPKVGHWLVLHGRYICNARKPKCSECFLTNNCQYYLNTIKKD